jgi:hypothetical protein
MPEVGYISKAHDDVESHTSRSCLSLDEDAPLILVAL